jgi:hypothetical protein
MINLISTIALMGMLAISNTVSALQPQAVNGIAKSDHQAGFLNTEESFHDNSTKRCRTDTAEALNKKRFKGQTICIKCYAPCANCANIAGDFSNIPKKIGCFPCGVQAFETFEDFYEHVNTPRHCRRVLKEGVLPRDRKPNACRAIWCEFCKIKCLSQKNFDEHVLSLRHMNKHKQALYGPFNCLTCDELFENEARQVAHFNGKRHKRTEKSNALKNACVNPCT